jgi:hypothetical protein
MVGAKDMPYLISINSIFAYDKEVLNISSFIKKVCIAQN